MNKPSDFDDEMEIPTAAFANGVRQRGENTAWSDVDAAAREQARLSRYMPAEAEIVPPDVRDWFVRHTENGDWKAGVREALRRHVEQAAL